MVMLCSIFLGAPSETVLCFPKGQSKNFALGKSLVSSIAILF